LHAHLHHLFSINNGGERDFKIPFGFSINDGQRKILRCIISGVNVNDVRNWIPRCAPGRSALMMARTGFQDTFVEA
jgi:hypothetical protein